MPNPKLIHPVTVKLRKINRKFTAVYDENFKEPIGQSRRSKKDVVLRAQVKINDTDSPAATEGGVQEESQGYLLFLTRDLRAANVVIERGDRVVQVGGGKDKRDVDYYITKFQWRGHYPGQDGPTLLKAFFEDRHPSRQRGQL